MELEVTVPDESVGAINGDLNSRRGRLHGMEPKGGMTTIKAEVPMAEVLTYNQALVSLTGGRGDYHMQFLRYEEVPAHIAQKLIDAAKRDREAVGSGRLSRQPSGRSRAVAKRSALDWFLERRHLAALRHPARARDRARLRARAEREAGHEDGRPDARDGGEVADQERARLLDGRPLRRRPSDDWITNGGSTLEPALLVARRDQRLERRRT